MLRDYLINLLNELKKTPGMKSVFHDWLILEVGATPIEIKSNFENLSDNRISEILHNTLCEVVKTTDMNTEEYTQTSFSTDFELDYVELDSNE